MAKEERKRRSPSLCTPGVYVLKVVMLDHFITLKPGPTKENA
jgi:hypothetical protein